MRVRSLGHVVLKVRDLRRSEAFYADLLGIRITTRITQPVHMTFFTLGHHHDFALMELDRCAVGDPHAPGLAHVAFDVGQTDDEWRAALVDLAAAGIAIEHERTNGLGPSVFVLDPDGNEIELYVDTSTTITGPPRSEVSTS